MTRQTKDFLSSRQLAYTQVFDKENQFLKVVLEDLAKFCRVNESCFHADPRIHAALEGRREVWLRIKDHLDLPFEELYAKYVGSKQRALKTKTVTKGKV